MTTDYDDLFAPWLDNMTDVQKDEFEVFLLNTEQYASLISQHNYERPKLNLFVRSVDKPGIDISVLAETISSSLDLDNAAGPQLDVIGEYLGLERALNYIPVGGGDREMSDDEYRIALKLAIARNTWDGTLGSVGPIYKSVFGNQFTIAYVDRQNMHVDINVYGDVNIRVLEIMEKSGLLLLPAGVSKTVNVIAEEATIDVGLSLGVISEQNDNTIYIN